MVTGHHTRPTWLIEVLCGGASVPDVTGLSVGPYPSLLSLAFLEIESSMASKY